MWRTRGAQGQRDHDAALYAHQHLTNYVEIEVSELDVVKGRDGVFVIPGRSPLDVTGRIRGWERTGVCVPAGSVAPRIPGRANLAP
ncbi:HYD1 signature containing ADP-ribosyltransferase family protein [Microbacterium immunditiarum]|uniref:HYD1 signature containing ADP-ribosyltransferase family protein n=1 Tax=Microbacterium immunditiarum TaxID=337480 RepID=UPI003CCD4309